MGRECPADPVDRCPVGVGAHEAASPDSAGQAAYPLLRGQLSLRWVDGETPQTVLDQATWYQGRQSLAAAEDPAAALTWRVAATTATAHWEAPLTWLPTIPPVLRHNSETSDYLDQLTERVIELKDRVADEAGRTGSAQGPPWQRALPPDVEDQIIGDLAIWRRAHDIPPTEPNPHGSAPTKEPGAARHQARLARRLTEPFPLIATRKAERHVSPASPPLDVSSPGR